jgi:hypothetical protein
VCGLAAVGPCDRLEVLRPSPAGLECSVEDRMSRDGHHRCVALAREGTRLVGLCDVLDLKVSHCGSPQARSLDLLSLSGPFVRVNVAARGPAWSRTPSALRASGTRDRIGRPGTARPMSIGDHSQSFDHPMAVLSN